MLFSNYSEMEDHHLKCRMCLSTVAYDKQVHINQQLFKKIVQTIKLQFIQTKNYSSFICQECNSNLEAFSTFRDEIIEKQKKLGFYLCRIKEEITIKEELDEQTEIMLEETIVIKNEILTAFDETSQLRLEPSFDEPKTLEANAGATIKELDRSLSLNQPEMLIFTKKGSLFYCEKCDKTLKEKRHMQDHLFSKHGIGAFSESKIRGKELITCDTCGKLVRRQNMQLHVETIHQNVVKAECDICGMKFYNKTRAQAHIITHIPAEHRAKKFKCHVCQRNFTTIYSLRTHNLKNHAKPIRKFECHCGKAFRHQDNLRNHIRYIHKEVSLKRACKYCGKEFRLSTVKKHEILVHKKEYKYLCKYKGCGKKFWANHRLTRHINMSHLNLKPFVCSYPGCTEAFGMKDMLKAHHGLDHLKLREKCPIEGCKYSHGRRHYLKLHLKKHVELSDDEIYCYRNLINEMNLV